MNWIVPLLAGIVLGIVSVLAKLGQWVLDEWEVP